MPTTIITVIARIRRAWPSNSRNTSELVIGAIAAAAIPRPARRAISSPVDETASTSRLSVPKVARPTCSTRRRPKRSAMDPAVSSSPPKVSEYAPVIHCSEVVLPRRSRPMVGRAIVSSVLSTISTKNARHSAARGIQAARSEG